PEESGDTIETMIDLLSEAASHQSEPENLDNIESALEYLSGVRDQLRPDEDNYWEGSADNFSRTETLVPRGPVDYGIAVESSDENLRVTQGSSGTNHPTTYNLDLQTGEVSVSSTGGGYTREPEESGDTIETMIDLLSEAASHQSEPENLDNIESALEYLSGVSNQLQWNIN
ncbi:MAG: hypothetical protein ACQESB_01530, partial [Elusimicrobiota bacterium]